VSSLDLALTNFTSVSVLVFALGLVAARFHSDVRIPEPVYQVISVYLLFGIGLKGGVALRGADPSQIAVPMIGTVALGVAIPLAAFFILKVATSLNEIDRGSLAAHYGSTSLVTFSALLVFLESNDIFYEGFATTLLTVMEIPGIVVGIFLGSLQLRRHISWGLALREIVFGKTVVLLLGGLIIGAISGNSGYARVTPFFVDLLPGILALFLLHLGYQAGSRMHEIRRAGAGLILFALVFPVFAGAAGVIVGHICGLSMGGAVVLGILSASASYIAAPAAVSIALPEANPSTSIVTSLGITFPFNLIVGIPLLLWFAELITTV
jgi:uncharacterized protein